MKQYFIITGGIKRIGAKIAEFLVNTYGYSLIIHYHKSHNEALKIKKKLEKINKIEVKLLKADLTIIQKNFIRKCLSLGKPIVGLINNASVFLEGNLKNGNHLMNQISLHALSPLSLTQQYQKLINKGVIINITDANLKRSLEFQNYQISKKILQEITLASALALAPNIRVNSIAPGPLIPLENETENNWKQRTQNLPLKSPLKIENALDCLKFILNASFLTGQTLYADNGAHLL